MSTSLRKALELAVINDNIRAYKHKAFPWIKDVVVMNVGNRLEHELKKAEITYKLLQQGHTVICEAVLANGKRADVLVIDVQPPIAYEIMASEEMKSIERKKKEYSPIRIIPVQV